MRRSREFIDFLTRPELKEAFGCLRAGQYTKALDILVRTVPLQEKLTSHCPVMVVPSLCAMLVCHRDLECPAEAFAAGERALQCLQAREGHRYYAPLLDAMACLAYELGKDFVSLQKRLEENQLRKPAPRGFTLKELTVQEYLYTEPLPGEAGELGITMARGLLGVDSEWKEPLWALACGMTLNKPLLWSSVSPSMLSGDASGHPWKPLLVSCVPLMPGPLRLKTTNPAAKTLESHINLTEVSVGSWRRGFK